MSLRRSAKAKTTAAKPRTCGPRRRRASRWQAPDAGQSIERQPPRRQTPPRRSTESEPGWSGRNGQRSPAVAGRDAVDVGGADVGDRLALDLDHVLRVALTTVREVEAAHVHVLGGDQDLPVQYVK